MPLVLAVLVGLINGVFINEFKVPPLITTLGTMTTLRGLSYVLCGGMPIFGFPDQFRILGQDAVLLAAVVFDNLSKRNIDE